WKRLSPLPAEGFAEQAPPILDTMRQSPPLQEGVGAFVLARLTENPPKSLEDLAKAYNALLTGLVERPADLPADQATAYVVLSEKLNEAGKPFVLNDDEAKELFDRAQRNEERERHKKIDTFRSTSDAAPPRAMVLKDRATPVEPVVFVRGNPGRRGDVVPRQFLEIVEGEDRQPFASDASGRLDLARAITDPANPLTARVIVNRVWQHHFGEGIVRTPSDFGVRAEPPTHPALLDWLAAEFLESGWSIKRLHRTILLSTAYRQSSRDRSVDDPRLASLDPTNRLLWRMVPRR